MVEKAQEHFDEEESARMAEKMLKAEFDFEDFLTQMRQMKKLGSMGSIAQMLPGMGNVQVGDKEEAALGRHEAIILSMTKQERRFPRIIGGSRRKRIADGAGVQIRDVNLLIKHEIDYNYKVIKPKPLITSGKIMSSTLIRNLLENGYLDKANKLLDRKWCVEGCVEKGRQIGKKIGFPTCNIDIKDYVISMPGVYAVNVKQKNSNKSLKAIANLGYRPTFNQKKILLEVHIFNFSGNLYNKHLSVEFTKFIRKEKKFKKVDQLKKQIQSDLKVAKS